MKLSEMQKSPDVGLPEDTYDICVAGKLVKERNALDRELFEVQAEIAALEHAKEADEQPMRRMGEKSPLAVAREKAKDIAARGDVVRDRMKDHTITLHLRGKTAGSWREWASRNQARDQDTDPGLYGRDMKYAGGTCNIDALVAVLGDYVVKYGDEDPWQGAWDVVASNAAPGDLSMLASKIVGMHEQVVDLGKSRRAWLATRSNEPDSE